MVGQALSSNSGRSKPVGRLAGFGEYPELPPAVQGTEPGRGGAFAARSRFGGRVGHHRRVRTLGADVEHGWVVPLLARGRCRLPRRRRDRRRRRSGIPRRGRQRRPFERARRRHRNQRGGPQNHFLRDHGHASLTSSSANATAYHGVAQGSGPKAQAGAPSVGLAGACAPGYNSLLNTAGPSPVDTFPLGGVSCEPGCLPVRLPSSIRFDWPLIRTCYA